MPNMASKIITGIDIGTVSVKAVSAIKNSDRSEFEILAKIQRPVSGVRKGVVSNVEEVSGVILGCIKEMELQMNQKIGGVYVNINGGHIVSLSSRGLVSVSRADQKISSEDIERVIQAAKAFPISRNKEIIDVFPREFTIDGVGGIKDPLDMQGVRFEVEVLIMEGFTQYLKNVTQSISDLGIQVNDLIPGVISAARSVLSSTEEERGVAILDIGASTSSLAVFEEGVLLHAAVFPIGSNNITNDIAIGLKCDIDTAERIKLEFGSCVAIKGDKKVERVSSLGSDEKISFTKTNLRKIINARVCEIFDLVDADLKKISKSGLLPAGIVITGGGSLLPGITELARKEFKLPARTGNPSSFNPLIEEPSFAVACGLVVVGHELEDEHGPGTLVNMKDKVKRFFKSLMP